MSRMFYYALDFNQPIGNWNVSKVTDMNYMFAAMGSSTDFNQDISQWDVFQVTDMSYMFANAVVFNQDITIWLLRAARVTLTGMFQDATMKNTYSLGNTPTTAFFNFSGFAPTSKTELVSAIAGWINGSIDANTTISDSTQGSGKYGHIANWDVMT